MIGATHRLFFPDQVMGNRRVGTGKYGKNETNLTPAEIAAVIARSPDPGVEDRGWATGGSVDGIPARLSDGEFVMNAAATQRMGRGNLAALNSGGGGEGGDDAIVAAINNLGDELGGRGETVINITINSDGTESQDSQGGQEDQHNLATKIKDVVKATIEEEKRLGGSLRRA